MPRRYKRKRLAEEWAQDIKPKKFGNYFNKSERLEAKREIAKELQEYTEEDIAKMKWDIEQQMAHDCYMAECAAARLGKAYNCDCEDVAAWSDEQVLAYLGMV